MTTWVALFRGINVGGRNLVPMAELRESLESLKFKDVRTYIQSGNVVFKSSAKQPGTLAKKVSALVKKEFRISPQVLVIGEGEFRSAVASNPFADSVEDPKTLHYFFLEDSPSDPDMAAISASQSESEVYDIIDRVFYLHAPDGIARSKLAANVERYLGVAATARNQRTVKKLCSMLAQ